MLLLLCQVLIEIALQKFTEQSQEGLLGILDLFWGNFFSVIFMALGIMPYISASIVIQLLGIGLPCIQKLQKEGESGKNTINQLLDILTIAICAVKLLVI